MQCSHHFFRSCAIPATPKSFPCNMLAAPRPWNPTYLSSHWACYCSRCRYLAISVFQRQILREKCSLAPHSTSYPAITPSARPPYPDNKLCDLIAKGDVKHSSISSVLITPFYLRSPLYRSPLSFSLPSLTPPCLL